jgi:predicted transcriptional regulator
MRKSSALDDLYWQDEILQVMFWLLGEGFAEEVSVAELRRFLDGDPTMLADNLAHLAECGLVLEGNNTYRLTEMGTEEAQRRFVDEFRPLLGRTGHGECNDDCWCHDPDHAGEPCPSVSHQPSVVSHQ